jgi:hypothetical protein
MPPKATSFKVYLPFKLGELEFQNDQTQQNAAWALYVELMTRIAIQPLERDYGLLREALHSLETLFSLTRQVLREAGPGVAAKGENSFGAIAMQVLNQGIRPFTVKWHSLLQDYEKKRPENMSAFEHEQKWSRGQEMRDALDEMQLELDTYAVLLAKIAGITHVPVRRGKII